MITLKSARLLSGYTQWEMAKILEIPLSCYSYIEKNPSLVTIEQAKIMSNYFLVPYDVIFFGKTSTKSREK